MKKGKLGIRQLVTCRYVKSRWHTFALGAVLCSASFAQSTVPWSTWYDYQTHGTNPVIPANTTVILDQDVLTVAPNVTLDTIDIYGKLRFSDTTDLELVAGRIRVYEGGILQIGTRVTPHPKNATITLNGLPTYPDYSGAATRGIFVLGGILSLHGPVPNVTWTRIQETYNPGGGNLKASESVTWTQGTKIAVSPTDYYTYPSQSGSGVSQCETENQLGSEDTTLRRNASGMNLPIVPTDLTFQRYGDLQYYDGKVISVPGGGYAMTTHALDERAFVGNLSRGIVIQGAMDDFYEDNGYGAIVTIKRLDDGIDTQVGRAYVAGVEFRRVGQQNSQGKYPFHWHMLSYLRYGTCDLGSHTGQYIRGCSFADSSNRGIVLHGTNGVTVDNNVLYNIRGHAVFTEDAAERKNHIVNNLVMKVRNTRAFTPEWDNGLQSPEVAPLKFHESCKGPSGRGSSGFWISNPDNTLIGNAAGDCASNGFWLAFPGQTFGLCRNVLIKAEAPPVGPGLFESVDNPSADCCYLKQVDACGEVGDFYPMRPYRMQFGVFSSNIAFCNANEGINLDWAEMPLYQFAGSAFQASDLVEVPAPGCSPNTKFVPLPALVAGSSGPNPDYVEPGSVGQAFEYAPCGEHSPGNPLQGGFVDYRSQLDSYYNGTASQVRFQLDYCRTWKNGSHGMWNRSEEIDIVGFHSADNCGRYFAGDAIRGTIQSSLLVGNSANYYGTRPDHSGEVWPVAFATYHSEFAIKDNTIYNFPLDPIANGRVSMSGVFATEDYYLRPVELGQYKNTGNHMVNSHPGTRMESENDDYALAGALHDPLGLWGPMGNYIVYDVPFFTDGGLAGDTTYLFEWNTNSGMVFGGPDDGAVKVDGTFFGFEGFAANSSDEYGSTERSVNVERFEYDPATGVSISVGDWGMTSKNCVPEQGSSGSGTPCPDYLEVGGNPVKDLATIPYAVSLPQFHHFAARQTVTNLVSGPCGSPSTNVPDKIPAQRDYYKLTFPDMSGFDDPRVTISNMHETTDTIVIGIPIVKDSSVSEVFTNWRQQYNPTQDSQFYSTDSSINSVEDLCNATLCKDEFYYYVDRNGSDLSHDTVWVRVVGGVKFYDEGQDPQVVGSQMSLSPYYVQEILEYAPFFLRIEK